MSPHSINRTGADPPTPYTKEREWGALQEHMVTTDQKLSDILAQCRSTNGRVTSLEKWRTVLMTVTGTLLATDTGGLVHVIKAIAAALSEAAP